MAMTSEGLHVVMLPWLAFGHMLPFLQLSKCLARTGIRITFISTPRNIDRLPKIPPDLAARINLVKLSLPLVDNLPENAEASIDIPGEKMPYLLKAYDLLQHPFEQFLIEESPDWVIHDFLTYWAAEISVKLGVSSAYFSTAFAWVSVFFNPSEVLTGDCSREKKSSVESMTSPPDWIPFPSSLAYRHHEAIDLFAAFYSVDASGVSVGKRFERVLRACRAVVVRSCREYEAEYLDLLTVLCEKPVIPVGFLPEPSRSTWEREMDVNNDWCEVFKWLDERSPESVVFVAFGSECELSRDQVHELAYGLELSMLPFVWALRKPHWVTDEVDVDVLPKGFKDRTSDRGFACMGWAPQLEILAHSAIGGCLIHCGCSSIIQCHQFGHAIVALPIFGDQGLNARMIVEKGLGMEVERNEYGSFTRDDIARSLRHAMVEDRGENLRLKARQMKALIPEWEHEGDYIGGFANYLKGGKLNDSPI